MSRLSAVLVAESYGIAVGIGDCGDALAPWHISGAFQHPDRLDAQLGHRLVYVIDVDITSQTTARSPAQDHIAVVGAVSVTSWA
jgi:hypothetical protein